MSHNVRDLAAAIGDGEAVEWQRVRATKGNPSDTVANLELLDRIAATSGSRRFHQNEKRRVHLAGAMTLWEGVLLLIAALRSIFVIVGTLWSLPTDGRDLLLAQLAVTSSCLVVGLFLIRGAGGDRRAISLSGILLTTAAATAWPHYRRLFGSISGPSIDPLLVVLPEAFFAYWIWAFVSVFPKRIVSGLGDSLMVFGRRFSLCWGALLAGAHATARLLPSAEPSMRVFARTGSNFWFWGIVGILLLLALPAMLLAARRADLLERRRTMRFLAGACLGFAPLFAIEVGAMLFKRQGATSLQYALELLPILSVPFTTAYGVLVKQILPFRTLFHQATRYLLLLTTMGLALGIPVFVVATALVLRPDQSVSETIHNPGVLAAVAASTILLVPLALTRRRLLRRVDRLFNQQPEDWHVHLARLSRGLGSASTTDAVLEAIERNVSEPLGVGSAGVFRPAADGRTMESSRPGQPPLYAESGPSLLLFDSEDPLLVDPADEESAFWWLPETDRRWILDVSAGLLIALTVGERRTGVLVLGPRRAERRYDSDEFQFLTAVAATVAATIERFASEPVPTLEAALECQSCGYLLPAGAKDCACGGVIITARLPLTFASRYRVERCVGQGAMGKVYAGVDIDLGRRVALKTLPVLSSEESIRLAQEARAMATVSHPNLAVLYGMERWNGAPVIVSEFMTGGTLSARIASRMEIAEIVSLGQALSSALEALHAASLVHRDVKPSNIGYADRGEAKLLDFGLAEFAPPAAAGASRMSDDLGSVPSFAGTPRYAPPEAWRGAPTGPEADLWALAMVLYECIAGRHPLAGLPPEQWIETLGSLPRPDSVRPDCPHSLADRVVAGLKLKQKERLHVMRYEPDIGRSK